LDFGARSTFVMLVVAKVLKTSPTAGMQHEQKGIRSLQIHLQSAGQDYMIGVGG